MPSSCAVRPAGTQHLIPRRATLCSWKRDAARELKEVRVLAITARDRSTRQCNSSPSCSSSASRTSFGIVTCPLEVIFALESIPLLTNGR